MNNHSAHTPLIVWDKVEEIRFSRNQIQPFAIFRSNVENNFHETDVILSMSEICFQISCMVF